MRAQNIFPVLHFLFSASPENGNNLAGAMSLEAIEYGFVETDSSSERTFGNIPIHVRPHKHFSFDPLWERRG